VIPDFIDIGSPWKVLPPGIHEATLEEIKIHYAITERRASLYSGLERGTYILYNAGCDEILLDGSFVTEKSIPNDYDVCWNPTGVDPSKLDPILLDFSNNRKNQKIKFFGEYFPTILLADQADFFPHFFQKDRDTGKPKGIIKIKF